jgi:hypothetical protein
MAALRYAIVVILVLAIKPIRSDQKLKAWRSDSKLVLGSVPSPRYQTCKASSNGKFLTFGGNGFSGPYLNHRFL